MQWHELIFSEKKERRLLRHALFWLGWWVYFSYCDYLFQHPVRGVSTNPIYVTTGSYILIKAALMVSVYAIASYLFIYLVLSAIVKTQWKKTMMNVLLLVVLLFAMGHTLYWYVFPFVNSLFGSYTPGHFATWFWPAVYLGLVNPVKVLAAAGIIKYVKFCWLKEKERERLESEKVSAELQLLKAHMRPDFLLNTLDVIYKQAVSSSPLASATLLRFSDLLNYMLYECEAPFVPLERDIFMLKEYIEIEKMRQVVNPEVEITVKGEAKGKCIAPFLLLPLMANSFIHCSLMTEQAWVNMEIKLDRDLFSLKLTNGRPAVTGEEMISPVNLDGVQKRLSLLYADRHELKITSEEEMSIVILNIRLGETFPDPVKNTSRPTSVNKGKAVLDYATD